MAFEMDASFPPSLEPDRSASEWLRAGVAHGMAGRLEEAETSYREAVRVAEAEGPPEVQIEALRRLGLLRHRRHHHAEGRALCERSYREAIDLGNLILAGEALNSIAGFDFWAGNMSAARERYGTALTLAGTSAQVVARVEQNLGILDSVQGNHDGAYDHYRRAIAAFKEIGDDNGCALVYHNLGLISHRRGELDDATKWFAKSAAVAAELGNFYLKALCDLHRGEVSLARKNYEDALHRAERALESFEQLGDRRAMSDAYKVVGKILRDSGRTALAADRLRVAVMLARETGWVQGQAEASRELAKLHQGAERNEEALVLFNDAHDWFGRIEAKVDVKDVERRIAELHAFQPTSDLVRAETSRMLARLYQALGRNREALNFLADAHRLYRRLDSDSDLFNVGRQISELEEGFLGVICDWSQSIEASDHYTGGHCERVAQYAVAIGQALGLDATQQTTLRLGGFLHDVGKLRIPNAILNKPGRLSSEELELMKLHPVFGLELLANVEFPWDIKPIIHWHHEKYDGTGYPDGLSADEIPLTAQVIGIADVYDALTTARSYRPALSHAEALAELERCRSWWSEQILEAFMRSVGENPPEAQQKVA